MSSIGVMQFLSSLLLISSIASSESYKILVYNSKFGHSHSNFLGNIADILADAGHNVTTLLPILDAKVRDGTEKSHKIYVQPDPVVEEFYANIDTRRPVNFFEFNNANPIVPFFVGPTFGDTFYRTCKRVLEEPGLIDRLKAEQFDVMIAENFDVCGVGISSAIAPKSLIGVSSSCMMGWQFEEWGVETAISYRPSFLASSFNVHSLLSRAYNIYGDLLGKTTFWYSRRAVNRALREHFGEEYPTVAESSSNVAYVFTNSEPLIESAAPTTSRVVNIGGIGAKTPKKLDEYWEGVLNRRPKTVLLSFGSIAKSIIIPREGKMGILKAISLLPSVTFIWKYEDPEDEISLNHASKLTNLVMTKWMPQVDILAHPNLSLFITHGGMGSTQETALRGKPGIFIPLFADQPRNAGMMEFNGFGKVFSKWDLPNGERLAQAITEVLADDKYRQNAAKVSKMLSKKPFSAKDLLIKHVEFAAEFGPSPALRPQSIDMSFIAYYNLDIVFVLLILACLLLYVSFKIVSVLLSRLTIVKVKAD